jgi:hypothetical protein
VFGVEEFNIFFRNPAPSRNSAHQRYISPEFGIGSRACARKKNNNSLCKKNPPQKRDPGIEGPSDRRDRQNGRHDHHPRPGIFCSLLSSLLLPNGFGAVASIFHLPSSIFPLTRPSATKGRCVQKMVRILSHQDRCLSQNRVFALDRMIIGYPPLYPDLR